MKKKKKKILFHPYLIIAHGDVVINNVANCFDLFLQEPFFLRCRVDHFFLLLFQVDFFLQQVASVFFGL